MVQVVIDNEHGTMDIAFTGEGYVVDDIPADVVDSEKLIDLLTACGTVTALRTVSAMPPGFGSLRPGRPRGTGGDHVCRREYVNIADR